jgi:glycosyltransferase involved in cell wall biosynthesis
MLPTATNNLAFLRTQASESDLESRWRRAVEYYRGRKSVLFISYCPFWEKYGFVQQCLAYSLAEAGVKVTWLDGAGWRPQRPTVPKQHPNLTVKHIKSLPGRRLPWVDLLDVKWSRRQIAKEIQSLPGKPVIWIQAGIDERLVTGLPYVDVFSVFDDPYRHSPVGDLCRKARTIICQNPRALECLTQFHGDKSHLVLPPMDMSKGVYNESETFEFPQGFPEKVMGYIGSFSTDGFDLYLFEDFVRNFPDYGFLLMGRTDAAGLVAIERLKRYPNFLYTPWVDRSKLAAVWSKLAVTLLFYRPNRTQEGAFPVKVLESLRFGVPCIATAVPKTEGLEGVFPRSSIVHTLRESLQQALNISPEQCRSLYKKFAAQMDPKHHLSYVAECLVEDELRTGETTELKRSSVLR